MAIRLWADADEEQADIQAATAQWRRLYALSARATRPDVERVSALAANYPWMRPGEVMPLAKAQVPPESAIAIKLAEASARRNAKVDGGFMGLGSVQKSPRGLMRYGAKALMDAGEWGLNTIKPHVREFVAMSMAPLEEATGNFRNVVTSLPGQSGEIAGSAAAGAAVGSILGPPGAVLGALGGGIAGAFAPEVKGTPQWGKSQSALGVSLETGKPLGEGFLPGGAGTAADIAVKRQTMAASVGGYALTPGRLLASSVAPVDSLPFNLMSGIVDARIAMKYDPSAFALGQAGKAVKNRRAFIKEPTLFNLGQGTVRKAERAAAGLLDEAPRPAVYKQQARTYLDGADGAELKTWLAGTDDFERIRRSLPGVDAGTVMDLRNAKTVEGIDEILYPKLGLAAGLETKPRVSGMGAVVKRGPEQVRLAARMPTGRVNLHDPTEAVEQLNRIQRLMKMDYDTISTNNTAFAEALLSGNRQGAREVFVNQVLGGSEGALQKAGIDPKIAHKLVDSIRKGEADVARFHVEKTATRTDPGALLVDDVAEGLPAATLISEAMDNAIFFDMRSLRDIRRAHSKFGRLAAKGPIDIPVSTMEFLQGEIWRPAALIRGAWAVRVIAEEQLRMAASGLDSMFRHPMSYLGWILNDRKGIGAVLAKAKIPVGRGQVGLLDDAFDGAPPSIEDMLWERASKYNETLNLKAQEQGWRGRTAGPSKRQLIAENATQTYNYGDPLYVEARAQRLADLHRDPVIRRMAEARATGTAPDLTASWALNDPTTRKALEFLSQEPGNAALGFRYGAPRDPAAIERYLRNNFSQVAKLAGDDPRMWRAVATGKLDDFDLLEARTGLVSKDALRHMSRVTQANPRGALPVVGSRAKTKDWKDRLDGGISKLYSGIMARPQALFSRGVTHRQHYWREAENVILGATPEAQARFLEQARKAKLPKDAIRRLERAAKASSGDLTLREAHHLLDGRGFDFTNKLLYDASQRSNLTDVMRIVWPFGEAQKEVLTRWARLMTENPAVPHRAAQVIRGARGAGVFTTDPQTNEEVFTVPLSGQITEKLLGVKIPLGGYAESLSFFGSGLMPGVGPVVQIAAKWLVPNSPEYDQVREIIDPFGGREQEPGVGILERHLPTWSQALIRAFKDPEKDAIYGNLVADVWAAGINQGKWRNDSPEALEKGLQEAGEMAKYLSILKGLSSLVGSPTPLSPRFIAEDPSGKWYLTGQLSKDYRKFLDDDSDTAAAKFVEKYGENAMVYMQSSSYSPGFSLATTDQADRWLTENKDVAEDYEDVYALFAPQGGEFDFAGYVRQFEADEKFHLTPENFAKRSNHMQASMAFYAAKDRFGPFPSEPQREWLRGLDEILRSEYPGYKENLHLPEKFDADDIQRRIIPQISEAVNDERLAGNEIAEATRKYLKARQGAIAQLEAAGLKKLDSRNAAPLSQWLRGLGDVLMTETPGFRDMFDRVFAGELSDEAVQPAMAEEEVVGG